MSPNAPEVALLLADITGSTPLYEEVGDAAALDQIAACLDRLRSIVAEEGGTFIRSKGDDVLCCFADPSAALRAARQMVSKPPTGPLAVHAGAHFGPIIHAHGDAFGDAVNLTARLAAMAKPGEALLSKKLVDQLPKRESRFLRLLDSITFKGKNAQVDVYSLLEDDEAPRTEITASRGPGHTRTRQRQAAADVSVTLHYAGRSEHCGERASLSIGRSPDCDVVVGRAWVSRTHAAVSVRRGKVQLEDRSSSGTYVSVGDGYEFLLRRETVLLTGSGVISPALRPTDARAEVIRYEVVRGGGEARQRSGLSEMGLE
jgi:adenylate cyclase